VRKRLGKIMVVLLCLSLILFVGCDKTETGKEQEEIGTDKQKEVEKSVTKDKHEPEPGKKYVLEWAITNTHQLAEDPTVVKYFEEKMNVKFNVWSFDPTTQYEQLGLKIASGEVPDVWTVSSWSNYESFANQGVLYEIDEDAIKKYAPNLFKMYKDENPNSFKYFRINGKLYGLSGYRDHYLFNRTPVVWRGDWLEKVGISKTPETIDEFEEALYKFTKEDPDGNGENDTYGLSTSAISLFYGAFGQPRDIWFEKDGKLAYSTVQPEVKDTLAFLTKLYEDGIIDPEFITGENEGGYWGITHAFINGKIGLTSHGVYYHWTVSMYEGHPGSFNYVEMKKINPEAADRLVFGLPPKGPSGNMGVVQEQPIPGSGNVFGISIEKDPGKLGKILQIFDFVYENEINYHTARRGIKGVHWEFDDTLEYWPFRPLSGLLVFQLWYTQITPEQAFSFPSPLGVTCLSIGVYAGAVRQAIVSVPSRGYLSFN
jgi:putative aldouronate transport system substrate-binding protein